MQLLAFQGLSRPKFCLTLQVCSSSQRQWNSPLRPNCKSISSNDRTATPQKYWRL